MVLGLIVFLVGLMVSIAVHELGHLVVAKSSGARVSEFMVGFGPRLASFTLGPTRYGIKLLPFGGYVRILGMHAPGKGYDREETAEERAVPGKDFYQLSVPRRSATLLAGVTANLLLAAALLAVVLGVLGLPAASNKVAAVSECASISCTAADRPAPALAAGIVPGDRIVSLDGSSVSSWDDLLDRMARLAPGDRIVVELDRDGIREQVEVLLAGNPTDPERAFLGVSPALTQVRESPSRVPSLLWEQTSSVAAVLVEFPSRVGDAFNAALTGTERDPAGAIGIVGAGRLGAELGAGELPFSVRLGQLLTLLAGLNVSLAVFNLIPLVPLDGGHVVVTWFEGARRRLAKILRRPDPGHVDMRRLMPLTYLVVAVFITASLVLLWADLVNPVSLP